MDKLTEKAAALLREGAATLVIGYGEDKGNKTRPLFCRIPEEAARLVYDARTARRGTHGGSRHDPGAAVDPATGCRKPVVRG